ncbi:Uncharacterized protein TCM_042764 [Theobroma cacao]|uniref:MBD domain-containing protein n=1 Tax=Theobroma cacao TaxID=3641 RepID=A0A061FND4_THECC|nr:Uncharacterized protein TCM_042764 [Theobroma cacao]
MNEGETKTHVKLKQPCQAVVAADASHLRNIRERPRQRRHRRKPGSTVTYRDQSDHGYGWLLPGWVAEERRMLTGRLYTYYYDRWGRQYNTKREVLYRLAVCGLILVEVHSEAADDDRRSC